VWGFGDPPGERDNGDVDIFARETAGGRSDAPDVVPALSTADKWFEVLLDPVQCRGYRVAVARSDHHRILSLCTTCLPAQGVSGWPMLATGTGQPQFVRAHDWASTPGGRLGGTAPKIMELAPFGGG
jgi:hypothetical protein